MITDKEFNISNKNYVKKDFPIVYEELLDLCTRLSNRWNPDSSDESDPGIVLLKLLAFIADKNNYNIDKNVLECFLPSATQETSARNLFEMNGYEMQYYISAITPISFRYSNDLEYSFTLKKYDTVVTSEDSSINYTLIEDCQISSPNVPYNAKAIEGTLEFLTVGDSTKIQLNNLDDNNRIYFPETRVAQNGIFITNDGDSIPWERVTNLHSQELGNKYYKFGYDSGRSLPYIEFPTDISKLIGTGLIIRYIITRGAEGNISSSTLKVLASPDKMYDNSLYQNEVENFIDYLSIENNESSSNGADPESIDDAYMNFKRTVGTFNTLVTPRDYANYIYNLVDEVTLKNIVSNIQVADRRTDFNYSNNITTYSPGNGVYLTYNTTDENITPFEICLYPLKPITTNYTLNTYNDSFTPLSSPLLESNPNLSDAKCLSHDFKELSGNDVYCFKNKYTLYVNIYTYDAVDYSQQSDIISKVKSALYRRFNSRMVNFGDPLSQRELENVIKAADNRISSVSFNDTQQKTYVMSVNGTEEELLSGDPSDMVKEARLNLAAKNVLNGKISLFDFNDDYLLEYNQEVAEGLQPQDNDFSVSTYNKIKAISSKVIVPNSELSSDSGYKLRDNEIVQLVSPNLETEREYGIYVNYRFTSSNVEYIPANSFYKLVDGDELRVVYTDADTNLEYNVVYDYNSITINGNSKKVSENIFQPTFDLYVFDDNDLSRVIRTIVYNNDTFKYWVLSSNETIQKKVFITTTLNQPYLPCYWITNTENNVLFSGDDVRDGKITRLLQNGEYFMYSNRDLTELVILGSGTRLTLNNIVDPGSFPTWTIGNEALLDIEDINNNGLAAFGDINWQNKQLTNTPLDVEEMKIVTFTSGDTVKITGSNVPTLDNEFKSLAGCVVSGVRSDGSPINLDDYNISGVNWLAKSRLDIISSKDIPMTLHENQEIVLYDEDNDYTISGTSNGVRIGFNYNVQYLGSNYNGEKINTSNIFIDGLDILVYKDYSRYTGINYISYPKSNNELYSSSPIYLTKDNTYEISLSGFGASVTPTDDGDEIIFKVLPFNKNLMMMVYYETDPESDYSKLTLRGSNAIRNITTGITAQTVEITEGMNMIIIPGGNEVNTLYLTHDKESLDKVYISKLTLASGVNNQLLLGGLITEEDLLSKIETLSTNDGKDNFYYLNRVSNDNAMSFQPDETLVTPRIFWDKNNIVNKFTLPQIDFNSSSILIARESQK